MPDVGAELWIGVNWEEKKDEITNWGLGKRIPDASLCFETHRVIDDYSASFTVRVIDTQHQAVVLNILFLAGVTGFPQLSINPQVSCPGHVVVAQFVGVRMVSVADPGKLEFGLPLHGWLHPLG